MSNKSSNAIGAAALAILLLAPCAPVGVSAQDTSNEARSEQNNSSDRPERTLEGVWRTEITPTDCQTGAPLLPFTFPGLLTFHQGGTSSETAVSPGGPTSRSPGHGIWSRIDSSHYAGSIVMQLFYPDGTFAGRRVITQNIQLDRSGDIFNDTATSNTYDAQDNIIVTRCATAVGTRFE